MQPTLLSNYYAGFGIKRLTRHEVDETVCHGHEFQGISALRTLLGTTNKQQITSAVVILQDCEPQIRRFNTTLTWYNSRSNKPHRSPEWRLYYPHDATFMRHAVPDDLICVAKTHSGQLHVFIARKNSSWERKLTWLFQQDPKTGEKFVVSSSSIPVGFSAETVLADLIGDEDEPTDLIALPRGADPHQAVVDAILAKFKNKLPSSNEFSRCAREHYQGVVSEDFALKEPDRALTEWYDWEHRIFKAFAKIETEAAIASFKASDDSTKLEKHFQSLQQRRFSRAGSALENHVEAILRFRGLRYSRQPKTENKKEPDFVFPGIEDYRTAAFPELDLRMLGCKTSCKDRWRQILSEADRIKIKHVITLEPGISTAQTDEMAGDRVKLVIPKPLFSTYTKNQQKQILSFEDFLNEIREIEARHASSRMGKIYVVKPHN